MMSKLTGKQARFVEEYLIDLNATQAAIRAGYKSGDIGRQIITKTHVLEAIEQAQAKLSEETLVTQKMVIEGLLSEAKLSGEGSSHSARVSAWAHLGKHLGMFVEKVESKNKTELTGEDGQPIKIESTSTDRPQMTKDEWLKAHGVVV